MTTSITTWLGGYFALQSYAMESRGFVEINEGTEDALRWPRTTGADVISIAAVLDPIVRALPLRFGGHGIARRWRACMDELEAYALVSWNDEYPENRSFWRTLPAICVYLHSEGAPLPAHEVWDALLAQLAEPMELRNAKPPSDGPFKHFDVTTFSDLYIEQYKYLRELRGADNKDPEPGMGGANKPIPRTTNGDVVLLADYWSKQLADVKEVMGHDGVVKRWKEILVDVDAIARHGDPNAVYPKNNGFWRALSTTAIHVSVADEAPSKTDLMLDSLTESLAHLPENVKAGAKAAADAVGDLAHTVGKVANEAGKGLFSGFGTPLLVGAGLLGLFLIARNRREESTEA